MTIEKFIVPGVSCQHCVSAVTQEVSAISGVQQVDVNLETKVVTVTHAEEVAPEAIIAAIQEAGYEEVSPAA